MRAPPLIALLAVAAVGGGFGLYWWNAQAGQLPQGLAHANGRVEVERIDIATKLPGRVLEIAVREGDGVARGAVVARLDKAELMAQRAAAMAAVRRAEQAILQAEAQVAVRQAEVRLSGVELKRGMELSRTGTMPASEVDRRKAQNDVASATLEAARANVGDAKAAWEAAKAQLLLIDTNLAETDLTSPTAGRIEYRLAHPGEVLAAGGRVATLLDLSDVFMTVFLPTGQTGRVAHGSDARIVLDAAPDYVIPAKVSFVAAEAQFTPKAVETADEREKLMYRVKLSIDPALLTIYRDYVRAGLTGQAYVKLDPAVAWPDRLATKLPAAPAHAGH
ncbi:efflux transporter periplasmic adaptor subunit [Niveispirillum lacus]|uniref:Efflux transporter periplasmic adaptor subunit n=1 Tax=Niveispirillum lacus TaxID=1981099 RepID=A0A255Z3H6_9PROT|nr:HlyD family efflux transporter periplasmic adaptor subunit [Niveispirillum lacus]OYQ35992.1 efflux transporter periplasmic adaptor subunit [Niveispirillum lacus]